MVDDPATIAAPRHDHQWSNVAVVAALIAGVAMRIVGFTRPLNQPSWRQGDLYAIARSFAREGVNPLVPKVAWRGTTSGAVEGEFPVVGWTTGMLWRMFGEHGWMLKILPLVAGLLSLAVFAALARKRFDTVAANWAIAFFAVNPLAVFASGAVQSDSLMLLGILVAVWAAWHWADAMTEGSHRRLWPFVTASGLVFAGLSKITALHVGLAVAAVLLVCGPSARVVLRQRTVWIVGLVSLAVPTAWAIYAHTIYNRTGLSLGVSNERHWAGAELLTNPELVKGIVGHELRLVWLRLGIPVAVLGAVRQFRRRNTKVVLLWLASTGVMLLVAARTTGDGWAYYYHLPVAAPAALLMGAGIQEISSIIRRLRNSHAGADLRARLVATLSGLMLCALGARSAGSYARPVSGSPLHSCAVQMGAQVKSPDLLLTSGGTRFDSGGHGVAYDASYMFQWLDVFGWTLPVEDQTLANVDRRKKEGARWLLVEREPLRAAKGFEQQLRSTYPIAGQCDAALLFDLRP